MPNREKAERNKRILELDAKGWRDKSIANMLHEKESTISMVICRARWRAPSKPNNDNARVEGDHKNMSGERHSLGAPPQ